MEHSHPHLLDFNFQQLKEELAVRIRENRTMDLKFSHIVEKLENFMEEQNRNDAG